MAERGPPGHTLHGTALVIGTVGLLIEGESGAGKTTLALALIEACRLDGRHAALVADDRVRLALGRQGAIARPPARLAGLVEVPGHGIVGHAHIPACRIDRVIALTDAPTERMASAATRRLFPPDGGAIDLPMLRLQARGGAPAVRAILSWLDAPPGATD